MYISFTIIQYEICTYHSMNKILHSRRNSLSIEWPTWYWSNHILLYMHMHVARDRVVVVDWQAGRQAGEQASSQSAVAPIIWATTTTSLTTTVDTTTNSHDGECHLIEYISRYIKYNLFLSSLLLWLSWYYSCYSQSNVFDVVTYIIVVSEYTTAWIFSLFLRSKLNTHWLAYMCRVCIDECMYICIMYGYRVQAPL